MAPTGHRRRIPDGYDRDPHPGRIGRRVGRETGRLVGGAHGTRARRSPRRLSSAGARSCMASMRRWFTWDGRSDGTRSATPFARSRPVAHPRRTALGGRADGASISRAWNGAEVVRLTNRPRTRRAGGLIAWRSSSRSTSRSRSRSRSRRVLGGAAGSRTRVPRSQCSGLYVRRFRMISDVVLRSQTASTSTPSQGVPQTLDGRSPEVEPRDVAPTPLRGIRGGTSRVFRPREPGHCPWHLWFLACFVEVARAPSARSHGTGMTTVETVSAPLVRRIDAVQFSISPPDRWGSAAFHLTS
jgi:hypothetical protein